MILPSEPTVRQLVDVFDSLGVPHFQRGDVWNHDNVAKLLESILLDTPCGTMILWRPLDSDTQGVSLSGSTNPTLLIVDGQQRFRALHAAFGHGPELESDQFADEETGDTPRSEKAGPPQVWCLNLACMTEFEGLLADYNSARLGLFCRIADPRKVSKRTWPNVIPLDLLVDGNGDISNLVRAGEGKSEALAATVKGARLHDRVGAMLDKKLFFVTTLAETEKRNRIGDVVALFNRINSSGKRVEAEERAFAALVSLSSDTGAWLGRVFHRVYPPPSKDELERRDAARRLRDEILQRRKEHNFGFKFFIRVLVQLSAYYFGTSLGSGSFSFEVVSSREFQRRVQKSPSSLKKLFDRTEEVVVELRSLLASLFCDDLQMLPETTSLVPLIQLFIRFPTLAQDLAPSRSTILQSFALRMLLADLGGNDDTLRLVKAINKTPDAREALRVLDRGMPTSKQLLRHLKLQLVGANALQDRNTLLLYWLLRQRQTKDFSYKNLDEQARGSLIPGKEKALSEACHPQRQHVVPYSLLEELYQIEKRGRASRHIANNIGNITWISAASNSFDGGLGSRFVDLTREPSPDNAERHFLGNAGSAARLYRAVQKAIERFKAKPTDQAYRRAVSAFEEMCRSRRRLMAKAFAAWVSELSAAPVFLKRVEPEPLFEPSLADLVRERGYCDEFEDELVRLVEEKGIRLAEILHADRFTRRLRTSEDRVGLVVSFTLSGLEAKGKQRDTLFAKLAALSSSLAVPATQGSRATLQLPATAEAAEVLRKFRKALGRRRARAKKR